VDLAAYAVSGRVDLDVEPMDTSEWTTLESGVRYVIERTSSGNVQRGITDPVSYYVPNPFVEVKYTAYVASNGKAFASSEAARRPYNFQAGVKDEVQDDNGGMPDMYVGERRKFLVPAELCFRRKVFGQTPPKDEDVLIDVELLSLQPY
jgi:peptidylprolyl isomerase